MIFSQLARLPVLFKVGRGINSQVTELLRESNLSFKRVLIVSGETFSLQVAKKMNNTGWEHYVIRENSMDVVNEIKTLCIQGNYELILAVGGGKVQDTAKRVSYLCNRNMVSIPTIISNDGLISPISVLATPNGSVSLPSALPTGVVIDLDFIDDSPVKYLEAAAGDILSNLSATNDWLYASSSGLEYMNDMAFFFSRNAAESLIYYRSVDFKNEAFLRQIIKGQVSSGIAMALAGTSRPCSGSEHLLSHSIDFLKLSPDTLHGLQVASISLFCMYVQGKLEREHVKYAKASRVPLVFSDLHPSIEPNLENIFEIYGDMRPGRITVLDTLNKSSFMNAFDQFKNDMFNGVYE